MAAARNGVLVLALAALAASACVSVVPYAAQPARSKDPQAEILSIIAANPEPGCASKPEFTGNILSVQVVCLGNDTGSTSTRTLRPDRIESMKIDKMLSSYLLVVHHSGGTYDFGWGGRELEDLERLEDAISALQAQAAK